MFSYGAAIVGIPYCVHVWGDGSRGLGLSTVVVLLFSLVIAVVQHLDYIKTTMIMIQARIGKNREAL
jgi:hypothetical protein